MMGKVDRHLLIGILLVGLAGCGMHPLYGTAGESGGVAQSLASISIPQLDSRMTQLIRNNLLSTMRPAGQAAADRYVLTLNPAEKSNDIIDQPQPKATRQQVIVTVDYQLLEGGKVLSSGKTFSQVSYDNVRQPFSDMQAQADAEKRVALELSSDLRTRLASYFATH